jgi:hypothetical protein
VKQEHTSKATSILTTKSTYRNLSAQRLSERTVLHRHICEFVFVRLLTRVKECGIIHKNFVVLSVIPRSLRVEVASFPGCLTISAGKDLPTFRESVSKYYPSLRYSLPEDLSDRPHSCQNQKKTAKN